MTPSLSVTSGEPEVDTSSHEGLDCGGRGAHDAPCGRTCRREAPALVRWSATATPEALCERPLDHFERRNAVAFEPAGEDPPGMTVDISSLRIVDLDPDDAQAAEASYEITKLVRAHEQPDLTPPSRHRHVLLLRLGWPGHLEKHWLAYDGDHAVGQLSVDLPQRDNLENAWIELRVLPGYRRRGIGRALYAHAVEYVRAAGRTRLMADTIED